MNVLKLCWQSPVFRILFFSLFKCFPYSFRNFSVQSSTMVNKISLSWSAPFTSAPLIGKLRDEFIVPQYCIFFIFLIVCYETINFFRGNYVTLSLRKSLNDSKVDVGKLIPFRGYNMQNAFIPMLPERFTRIIGR